jgi:hypothetical protein
MIMQKAHYQPRRSEPAQPRVPYLAIHAHPCVSCGTLTPLTWFCRECEERAHAHREEDPYDELGGESEA